MNPKENEHVQQKDPPWFAKDELIEVAQRRHLQIVQRHPDTPRPLTLCQCLKTKFCLLYQFIYFANASSAFRSLSRRGRLYKGCFICFWCCSQPIECYKIVSHLEGQKYLLSQVQSKTFDHMDFFLQTYMSGSTPSWSRKKPIGVFFFKPKVSATLLTCKYSG